MLSISGGSEGVWAHGNLSTLGGSLPCCSCLSLCRRAGPAEPEYLPLQGKLEMGIFSCWQQHQQFYFLIYAEKEPHTAYRLGWQPQSNTGEDLMVLSKLVYGLQAWVSGSYPPRSLLLNLRAGEEST